MPPQGAGERVSKRSAQNLNHVMLPEIMDFNALCDAMWLKLNAKRNMMARADIAIRQRCASRGSIRPPNTDAGRRLV